MKAKKYIKLLSIKLLLPLFAISLVLSSCTIDDSINQSPNAINQEAVNSVDGVYGLSIAMQVAAGDFYCSDRSRISSIFAWQMCAPPGLGRPQPEGWNTYQMQEDGPPNDLWQQTGYRGVKVTTDIMAFVPGLSFGTNNVQIQNSIIGMAETYRALFFGEMAALYGSIPIDINELEPATFVTQRVAYDKVQELLSDALTKFADAGAYDRDLNFGGDGALWTAAVHTLKARFHLHMGEYSDALTEANLGIASADGNVYAQYSTSANEYSPWGHWTNTEVGEPIRCEATFMRMLNSEAGDTRIAEYFTPNDDNEFWGFAVHGEANADSNELDASKTCHLLKYGGYGDNFPIVSYEENILIRAECKARTGDVPGAVQDVNLIRTAAGLPDFASTDKQEVIDEILKQKNLQLFLEGQAYNDMRRTGTLPTGVPYRWIYPESETNANPNYQAVQAHDKPGDPELVKWILSTKYGGLQ